jgi:hypothetical protein
MDPEAFQDTLRGYLNGDLPLEVAAVRLAKLATDEGWYLYHNPDRGTPEARERFEVLQLRVEELVASWRRANGERPPRVEG